MFGEIISALDALLKALNALNSPDRKRRSIAKRLIGIFNLLDQIIMRGNVIINSRINSNILLAQVQDLKKLAEELNNDEIASPLKIYVDDFNYIQVIEVIIAKGTGVEYYISLAQMFYGREQAKVSTDNWHRWLWDHAKAATEGIRTTPLVDYVQPQQLDRLISSQEISDAKERLTELALSRDKLGNFIKNTFEIDEIE